MTSTHDVWPLTNDMGIAPDALAHLVEGGHLDPVRHVLHQVLHQYGFRGGVCGDFAVILGLVAVHVDAVAAQGAVVMLNRRRQPLQQQRVVL